jgi:hypothetical protein
MSFEFYGFLIIAAVIFGIGLLCLASLRKGTKSLEEIAYGEASLYRREKNNG